ncbi:MAG: DUF2809 domain-containing protein [Ardenticatenales bacterium]|nr:DUF2809 domain-containing protein [Ardenticatenales bacterium]
MPDFHFHSRRQWALGWLVPVLGLGILSRLLPLGNLLWDKYLGFTLLWPRRSIQARTMLTMLYVLAIELFQRTGVPAGLKQSEYFLVWLFAYAVLGSHFSLWDLLAYLVGIGASALAEQGSRGQD